MNLKRIRINVKISYRLKLYSEHRSDDIILNETIFIFYCGE